MRRSHFRFSVGALDCIAVSDGALVCGPPDDSPAPKVLFANAPQAEVDAALEEAGATPPWTHWNEECTCLLVDTGTQRILVDAGAGDLDPGTGRLVANLAGAGVAPSDIDAVILSHGHPDHIGGLVGSNGKPAFPAARVLLSKGEWEFWMGDGAQRLLPAEAAMLIDFARRTLPVIEDRVEVVDEETEVFPGVRYLSAPGHTPGHLAVELSSRTQRLLALGDLVLHPLHVEHPEWFSVVDADPALLEQTRRAFLAKVADEACLVHAFHFPFPGLGRLSTREAGWRWTSVS